MTMNFEKKTSVTRKSNKTFKKTSKNSLGLLTPIILTIITMFVTTSIMAFICYCTNEIVKLNTPDITILFSLVMCAIPVIVIWFITCWVDVFSWKKTGYAIISYIILVFLVWLFYMFCSSNKITVNTATTFITIILLLVELFIGTIISIISYRCHKFYYSTHNKNN